MTWGCVYSFGTVPTTGQEMWKMPIFAYNFQIVWPKITTFKFFFKCVTAFQVERYTIFQCRPFWVLATSNFVVKCYFLQTHYRIVKKKTHYVSLAQWLEGTQKVSGRYNDIFKNKFFKTDNNFCMLLPCHDIDLDISNILASSPTNCFYF